MIILLILSLIILLPFPLVFEAIFYNEEHQSL